MKEEIQKKIEIIKDFAKKMGYTIDEYKCEHEGRPCYSIELLETCDIEGNPYSWAWYLDTGKEWW